MENIQLLFNSILKPDCISIRVYREKKFETNYEYKTHSHKRIEINYIKDGACTMLFDDEKVKFRKNETMIIFPNKKHSFIVEKKTCKLIQLEFEINNLDIENQVLDSKNTNLIYKLLTNKNTHLKIDEKIDINNCISRIINELNCKYNHYELLSKLYVCELLVIISRYINQKITKPQIKNSAILEIIQFIKNNYTDDIKLENLCYEKGISSRYLRNCFQKYLHYSPNKYIHQLRFNRALKLLKDPQLSISDIAYESGFQSPQYFSKMFKQTYNCSPKEYRQNLV
jgi:AraC-like DNA-binding protein